MNSNTYITTDAYEFIWSNVQQKYTTDRVFVGH
ncbi:hypothetical protein T09_14300 [Trichinella sp. T9]|nr:hypothetical protein T09_6702 [Trichinella sp. T9]KRX38873.1 hypothetical protein T09_2621 [Trichinella sp. T9]KRX39038.1 hypothetical protein T09_14300 [Trichinella sp. T9]